MKNMSSWDNLEDDIVKQIKNYLKNKKIEHFCNEMIGKKETSNPCFFDTFNKFFDLNLSSSSYYKEYKRDIKNPELTEFDDVKKRFNGIFRTYHTEIIEYLKSEFSLDEPLDEILVEVLKEQKIKLKNYIFSSKDFDYTQILENLSKVEFSKCKFIDRYELINFKETLYADCVMDEIYFKNSSEEKCIFNEVLFYNTEIKKIYCEGITFKSRLFKKLKIENVIDSIELVNCDIPIDFILNNENRENEDDLLKINYLSFKNSTFLKGTKIKIQFCEIEKANFYNTKFEDLADFYQSVFNNVDFERTDFKSISIFSEVEFNCNVDFKYTKFLGKTIFRDTVIKKPYSLDLRNTIFDDEANFLDITAEKRETDDYTKEKKGKTKDIKVKNRETARIIKSFFDNQNNTIEANKFYALEMQKREEELDEEKKNGKDFFEWLIFKTHGLSSNHSQDSLVALFWILIFSFTYGFTNCLNKSLDTKLEYFLIDSFIIGIILLISIWVVKKENINNFYLVLCFYIFYSFFSKDVTLYNISNNINPFSIMTGWQELSFLTLIYKISIAFLIYQFIISIRQNTRRK